MLAGDQCEKCQGPKRTAGSAYCLACKRGVRAEYRRNRRRLKRAQLQQIAPAVMAGFVTQAEKRPVGRPKLEYPMEGEVAFYAAPSNGTDRRNTRNYLERQNERYLKALHAAYPEGMPK
jgi:hypothetical protein